MITFKQRLEELVKLRDEASGWIKQAEAMGEAITLAEELHAEVEQWKSYSAHAKQILQELRTAADKMKEALAEYTESEHVRTHEGNDDAGYTVRIWGSTWSRGKHALSTYKQARGEHD